MKHFVKYFMVPLQIYMCDVNNSVKQYSTDLFNVFILFVYNLQEIIPEERRKSVLTKYFEETLLLADSLGHADVNLLDQHHTEAGDWFSSFLISRIHNRFGGATSHHIETRLHSIASISNPHSLLLYSVLSLHSSLRHSSSHTNRRRDHSDVADGDCELDSLENTRFIAFRNHSIQQSGSQIAFRNRSEGTYTHAKPSKQHFNVVDGAFEEVGCKSSLFR